MTIRDAIERADGVRRGNKFSVRQKISWLSELDFIIFADTIDNPTGSAEASFDGYGETASLDTVLIAPETYADMYMFWIVSKIDLFNNDIERYNTSIALFNNAKQRFCDWYNRQSGVHKNTVEIRWDYA